jgi:hypothetical protein
MKFLDTLYLTAFTYTIEEINFAYQRASDPLVLGVRIVVNHMPTYMQTCPMGMNANLPLINT